MLPLTSDWCSIPLFYTSFFHATVQKWLLEHAAAVKELWNHMAKSTNGKTIYIYIFIIIITVITVLWVYCCD